MLDKGFVGDVTAHVTARLGPIRKVVMSSIVWF